MTRFPRVADEQMNSLRPCELSGLRPVLVLAGRKLLLIELPSAIDFTFSELCGQLIFNLISMYQSLEINNICYDNNAGRQVVNCLVTAVTVL